MKVILTVLDSVGIGESPDAAEYGDAGSNTLAHIALAVDGLKLPVLEALGLGNIPGLIPGGLQIRGVSSVKAPLASFGAMREMSRGKDTITGHWEMAGLVLREGLALFPPGPPSFPVQLIREFERQTNRPVIGNLAASGTEIIARLGKQQIDTGAWIVYTSADSVLQIAAHEQVIPLDELYKGCRIARELCNPLRVGRIIARPYIGAPGSFTRTANRRDFPCPQPCETILDRVAGAGIPTVSVGKIDDIFADHKFSLSMHSETTAVAESDMLELVRKHTDGFIFANLIDFDMLFGHRRDPVGYARALEGTDKFLASLIQLMDSGDLLIITADHGNDPTFRGTDHTREHVPLLVLESGNPLRGRPLGVRRGFYDIAQSIASRFHLPRMPMGRSFL